MAALGADARGFQPRRAGADDDDAAFGSARLGDEVGLGRFAPGRGVVDAEHAGAGIDTFQAIGRADAGTDFLLPARGNLGDQMRIGDVGPRHADHVELALSDGVAGGGDIGNLGGMEDRELGLRTHLAGKVEIGRGGHAGDGDDVGQRPVGVDMALDDVEEIDLAGVDETLGDDHALVAPVTLHPVLIKRHAHADDEFGTGVFAHAVEHTHGEPQAVVETAAVIVVALVGAGRPELVHQMAVGLELDAVHAGGLHARGGGAVILDDTLDVPILHLLGKGAMGGLADHGRGEHGQPFLLVPVGATAKVGELDHHRRAVFVAGIGEPLQWRDDLVLPGLHVGKGLGGIARDDGGTGDHGHGDAAARLLDVVAQVAIARQAVLGVTGLVRGRHDPVLQSEVLQLVRLQQRITARLGHQGFPGTDGALDRSLARCRKESKAVPMQGAWSPC